MIPLINLFIFKKKLMKSGGKYGNLIDFSLVVFFLCSVEKGKKMSHVSKAIQIGSRINSRRQSKGGGVVWCV